MRAWGKVEVGLIFGFGQAAAFEMLGIVGPTTNDNIVGEFEVSHAVWQSNEHRLGELLHRNDQPMR